MSAYNKDPDQYSVPRAERRSPAREVTMPQELWDRIDAEAARRGVTRSALLRALAEEGLKKIDTAPPCDP